MQFIAGADMFSGSAASLRELAGGCAPVPAWNKALLLPLLLVLADLEQSPCCGDW